MGRLRPEYGYGLIRNCCAICGSNIEMNGKGNAKVGKVAEYYPLKLLIYFTLLSLEGPRHRADVSIYVQYDTRLSSGGKL